ncbi:head-tail connector protein [Macrococcus capreoli]|uniref:head-tail connector protein n=1 Tax=Macrococcus capreoli TaxID=2982690 RepID=UPI003F426C21
MATSVTLEEFKNHIEFEEGMSDNMLQLYLDSGERYIFNSVGLVSEHTKHLVLLVASLLYNQRTPEKSIGEALDAITPLIIQEQVMNYEESTVAESSQI